MYAFNKYTNVIVNEIVEFEYIISFYFDVI